MYTDSEYVWSLFAAAVTGWITLNMVHSYAALLEAYGEVFRGNILILKSASSGDTSTYFDVTPSDGGSSHSCKHGSTSLSVLSYPNNSNRRFNDQKVIYQPDETLFQTSTYQSYFRFLGDNSGSGADNGNAHIFLLAQYLATVCI